MTSQHKCIFCKKDQYGVPRLIEDFSPWRRVVKRTKECPDCGKELENAREEVKLFGDPVVIGFDPMNCSNEKEEGVSIQEIFNDSIARTLWLGIGCHYLKDQHFRKYRMAEAQGFRRLPPKTLDNFRSRVNVGGWIFSSFDHDIARCLYGYVVRALMQEDRWPYFVPGNLPQQILGWRHEKPSPRIYEGVMSESFRKKGSRVILLEDNA